MLVTLAKTAQPGGSMSLSDKPKYVRQSLDEAMAGAGLDAIVAMSPENFLHLAGVYLASQRMIRERLATAIYVRGKSPCVVVSSVVAATVHRDSWIKDAVVWPEHETTPILALATELTRRGLDKGHIGLELRYLAAHYFEDLRERLPNVTWSDVETILDHNRMVKTPAEIELMRHNALIAERAIWAGFMLARAGTSERQMADRMVLSLYEFGGGYSPFMSLAAGEHTGHHHAVAGDYAIQPGDTIAVDMVGNFAGYYTDYARMAVVGEAGDTQRKAWSAAVEIQRQVIRDAVPGIKAELLAHNAERYARELGYSLDTNLVGHSLGIALHEYPPMTVGCAEELVPNMTMCVEILIKDEATGRYHVEDLVAIGDPQGGRRLTTYFDTKQMYQIDL
jgi:Xaa-Pro dipeptidase